MNYNISAFYLCAYRMEHVDFAKFQKSRLIKVNVAFI